MQRNCRRDAQADAVARVWPRRSRAADRRKDRIGRCGAHRFGNRTQLGREGVEQTGNCLIEAAVGDHRRNHRAHADIGVGLGNDVKPFDRRHRQHRRKIVTTGAALAQHLHRGEQRREIAVIVRAVAVDPGARVQQQFQGPEIADALPKSAVTMRVRIDQTRDDQPAGGIDPLRGIGGARRNNRGDAVAVQDDIRLSCGGLSRGKHGATNDDDRIGRHDVPLGLCHLLAPGIRRPHDRIDQTMTSDRRLEARAGRAPVADAVRQLRVELCDIVRRTLRHRIRHPAIPARESPCRPVACPCLVRPAASAPGAASTPARSR